ncbi:MAG: hypothetical protein LUQ07_04330 [Methanospirillum sp.]|nr:hypothetical protein [Methanospirillum sp.]
MVLLILILLSAGCVFPDDLSSLSDNGSAITPKSSSGQDDTPSPAMEAREDTAIISVKSEPLRQFIGTTFPRLTAAYSEIGISDQALDSRGIQNKALALEKLVLNITTTYNLDQSLPDNKNFPGLNAKEEIIFNKYRGYIHDLKEYASSLKQAVYWKNMQSDSYSLAEFRRYQDLSDLYKKQVITDIKKLEEYCRDWGYQYLGPRYMMEYSYQS